MLDITIENFEPELIQASMQQPMLLDIWAPWCGPCKALGPLLEKLEVSYSGRFKLAKLNADEQQDIAGQLSQMFGVRSIPFCVLFSQGQPVDGFVGALPEAEIRQFLDKHVPSAAEAQADEELQEAEQLLDAGDTDSALEKMQEAVAINPANDTARYDYLRALLTAGHHAEARRVYEPVAGQVLPALVVAPDSLAVAEAAVRSAPAIRVGRRARLDSLDGAVPYLMAIAPTRNATLAPPSRVRRVPDVSGLQMRDALFLLHEQGFRVVLDSLAPAGTSPAAGAPVLPGTIVTLHRAP